MKLIDLLVGTICIMVMLPYLLFIVIVYAIVFLFVMIGKWLVK